MGRLIVQEAHGMGKHVDHGVETLDRALRRTGRIEDERAAHGACHGSREATERAHETSSLRQPGCLSIDHFSGSLRGQVTRAEAGTTRGDDQPREAVSQLDQRVAHVLDTISGDLPLDHVVAGLAETLGEGLARTILAGPVHHTVGPR